MRGCPRGGASSCSQATSEARGIPSHPRNRSVGGIKAGAIRPAYNSFFPATTPPLTHHGASSSNGPPTGCWPPPVNLNLAPGAAKGSFPQPSWLLETMPPVPFRKGLCAVHCEAQPPRGAALAERRSPLIPLLCGVEGLTGSGGPPPLHFMK